MNAVVNEEESNIDVLPIIKRYSLIAAGVGLVPVPLLDAALVGSIQVKMVYDMAKAFNLPFVEARIKTLVASIIGSVAPAGASQYVGKLAKMVPVIGGPAYFVVSPALAYTCTYAVGRLFAEHFKSGGTLLNVDTDKFAAYFKRGSANAAPSPVAEEIIDAVLDAGEAGATPEAAS